MKVVSEVRWLHSLVTASTPMTGSTIDIGLPTAAANESKVRESRSPSSTVSVVAITEAITMLAISQKPERVSNILRSSTPTTRRNGVGAGAGRVRAAGGTTPAGAFSIVAVMPLLLRGCRRG